jgi:hypothetical protein
VATARGRVLLDGLGERLRIVEDQLLAGLDDEDRQSFRALLQRVAVHAATALDAGPLDGAAPDPALSRGRPPGRHRGNQAAIRVSRPARVPAG